MEARRKRESAGELAGNNDDLLLDRDAFDCVPSETDQLRKQIDHLRRRVEGIAKAYEGFKEEFLRLKSKLSQNTPPEPEYEWERDDIPKNARMLTLKDFTDAEIDAYVTERVDKEEPLWRSAGCRREEAHGIIKWEIEASIDAGEWFEVEGT